MKVLRRRKLDPASCTMIEFAYARTGSMLKAARVCAFVAAWAVVRRELGRPPTVDEYADWWREPRTTAFKHQAEFRAVFPGNDTPDRILDALEAQRVTEGQAFDYGRLVVA